MRRQIIIFFFLFLVNFTFGQVAKYSNEFLSIGVGARSLGMSNSSVANVNDVTSGYWNPAGLSFLETDFDAGIMHAEYFAGIAKYDYLGGAMALDTSSFLGATIIRFGVDDIPNTTDLIDSDGNVGIGTDKPEYTLDVGGITSIDQILFLGYHDVPFERHGFGSIIFNGNKSSDPNWWGASIVAVASPDPCVIL